MLSLPGYIAAILCGIVDFAAVSEASLFALPNFMLPKFSAEAIITILPVILVITSEHIGHQVVTSKIVGRDLLRDPGLHRSLLGDNLSTMLSGLIGAVPTTTYGENIGVMAVTKVYSVRVIAGAAVLSIICSFVGKLSMLIQTFRDRLSEGYPPSLRNDRSIRYQNPCRFQGGLRAVQESDTDQYCICDRLVRNCGKYRKYPAYRHGSGMYCRYDIKPYFPPAG